MNRRTTFIVAASILLVFWPSEEEAKNHRNLRFFDPDHRTCGQTKIAHDFAVHCLYGARQSDETYYMRKTVSTDLTLPRNSPKEVNQILKVLTFAALRTKRVIRVNQALLPGYNNEHKQPYSIISAAALQGLGIELVEQNYWNRALQSQGKVDIGKINHTVVPTEQQGIIGYLSSLPQNMTIEKDEEPDDDEEDEDDEEDNEEDDISRRRRRLATATAAATTATTSTNSTTSTGVIFPFNVNGIMHGNYNGNITNETVTTMPTSTFSLSSEKDFFSEEMDKILESDELVFRISDLLSVSEEELEAVIGITEKLICQDDHPNPNAIPKTNDALNAKKSRP